MLDKCAGTHVFLPTDWVSEPRQKGHYQLADDESSSEMSDVEN